MRKGVFGFLLALAVLLAVGDTASAQFGAFRSGYASGYMPYSYGSSSGWGSYGWSHPYSSFGSYGYPSTNSTYTHPYSYGGYSTYSYPSTYSSSYPSGGYTYSSPSTYTYSYPSSGSVVSSTSGTVISDGSQVYPAGTIVSPSGVVTSGYTTSGYTPSAEANTSSYSIPYVGSVTNSYTYPTWGTGYSSWGYGSSPYYSGYSSGYSSGYYGGTARRGLFGRWR